MDVWAKPEAAAQVERLAAKDGGGCSPSPDAPAFGHWPRHPQDSKGELQMTKLSKNGKANGFPASLSCVLEVWLMRDSMHRSLDGPHKEFSAGARPQPRVNSGTASGMTMEVLLP